MSWATLAGKAEDSSARKSLYYSFTAASQNGPAKDVSDFESVVVMVQGTYATGLNLTFQVSMDGTAWVTVYAFSYSGGVASISAILSANQTLGYEIRVGAFNYFRVQSQAWAAPSGQCDLYCVAGTGSAQFVSITGTTSVQGPYAHSASAIASPVAIGGQAKSAVDTTLVDGDASYLTLSTARQLIVKEFGSAELDWSYNTQGLTTTTTAAAAKAAGAANVRNYVTAIQAINTSATATRLLIQDGASTIWGCMLPANMTIPLDIEFKTPLRGSAATAMNYNFSAASATVDLNIQGFQNF